eukprot:5494563-Prymnesium_polylepis.1
MEDQGQRGQGTDIPQFHGALPKRRPAAVARLRSLRVGVHAGGHGKSRHTLPGDSDVESSLAVRCALRSCVGGLQADAANPHGQTDGGRGPRVAV